MSNRLRAALFLAALVLVVSGSATATTAVIINADAVGVGFNDPSTAAPVGGNTGTTLGAQRLIVVQAAADQWAATLQSGVPIRIQAQWTAPSCTSMTGLLAYARGTELFANFGGGSRHGHWYFKALANALSVTDQDPGMPDIIINFNVNVGQPGCLDGSSFYLGLDDNHGAALDLFTITLHELAHGLGFGTSTDASTGQQCCGAGVNALPSIYDDFLLDTSTGNNWTNMSASQRMASATNTQMLVWSGANVGAAVPAVLQQGFPWLTVSAPAAVAGKYLVGRADFGPALGSPGVTGAVAQLVDSPGNVGLACTPLSPANAAAVSGKIVLIDRGTCTFVMKADNVQAAGAIGIVVVDNVAGSPPDGLGGSDSTVTIPMVRITMADGATLKAALATLPPGGMTATIGVDLTERAGANSVNQAFMYAPNPFVSGSSVSHWDTSMAPNQLMEPFLFDDLKHSVMPPFDMTLPLLMDLGWTAQAVLPAFNYQGLWWAAPAGSESGWGINFAHQGDIIFASWFTYDATGKGLWLVMTAPKTVPGTYTGTLYSTTGPPFNALPFNPSLVAGTVVGNGTLTFADPNNGRFSYTVNGISQVKSITREVFGTVPTCATATGSLAAATNVTDLWWAAPAGSESGWGINLTQEGTTIFATWFTYALDGTPMWLVVTAPQTSPGVYAGTLYRTTGPPFNAVPFNPANVQGTVVGNASFTFSDGNNASFAYTVNGIAQMKAITREVFAPPGTVCQ